MVSHILVHLYSLIVCSEYTFCYARSTVNHLRYFTINHGLIDFVDVYVVIKDEYWMCLLREGTIRTVTDMFRLGSNSSRNYDSEDEPNHWKNMHKQRKHQKFVLSNFDFRFSYMP